jgi:hypothetical protein
MNSTSVSGAFFVSALSFCIGFGIAFLVDRNIKLNLDKKVLRVLASFASISLGVGIGRILNHVFGTIILGLQLNIEKDIHILIATTVLMPLIFYIPVWIFRNKNNEQFKSNQNRGGNLNSDDLLVSAVLGNKNAQFKIGQQYWIGDEKIKDAPIAYAWLRIAKENGSDASEFYLEHSVYKKLHQNDINDSIKIYENIKNAIKNKDVDLCELSINKSLDDRNIIERKIENHEEENDLYKINYSLKVSEYKNKYGVNDYDYAKAINEMNGILQDEPLRATLMSKCVATTKDAKQAEKKYIYIRAYEISKSANRNDPHIVKNDSSKLFPQELEELFKQNSKINNQKTEKEGIRKESLIKLNYFLIAFVILGLVMALVKFQSEKKEIVEINQVKKEEPNFYNSDMEYELKDCEVVNEGDEKEEFSKLKTSIEDRTGIISGSKTRIYKDCVLNGREYTCTSDENSMVTRIIFDTIYQDFTFAKYSTEANENNKEIEATCKALNTKK